MEWLEELIEKYDPYEVGADGLATAIRAELRKRMPKVKTYSDRDVYDKGLTGMAKDEGYNEALADVTKALGLEEE